MKKLYISFILIFFLSVSLSGQEIVLNERASLEQVYLDTYESENLLPMNDLNMEFGYVLYQTEIEMEGDEAELVLENIRDYAAVYLDGKLQGSVTENRKKLTLNAAEGKHTLQLYAENIGRITYGPEILDNSKGLFGSITLDGVEIENWAMIPLNVKDCDIAALTFDDGVTSELPSFHKGTFDINTPKDVYLDISGWGMGEVWINGKYMGSYWEEEKQQSIQIPASDLKEGKNEIVVFELKNNKLKAMKLSDNPIFK